MKGTIEFYYDYSSPYGYLGSERIEAIANKHDHKILWRPILLGAVFKVTKQTPLTYAPLKGDYSIMDFARSAREHKLNYKHPSHFPIGAVAASRATLWLREHDDAAVQAQTTAFVHAIFHAYFANDQDITDTAVLSTLAKSIGIDAQAMAAALAEPRVKDLLRHEVESAIEKGVFGSPMMMIGTEQFWGNDRLEQLDRWMATGGW